jgi:uncharacterized protein YyaL (SSP411 family)
VTVAWCEWSPDSFARAEAEQKPVLLSIVTAWSGECRLMDETTYADPGVVSLIDALFVAIRIDADRRPDLNERYNVGGWPTTVFLTTSGDMLSGGTYLTPPEMIAMLDQVSKAFRHRAADIERRRAISQAVRALRLQPDREFLQPDHSVVNDFSGLLVRSFDRAHGGFGSAPKLPHPYALLFALSLSAEPEHRDLAHIVDVTLERLSGFAGGFHRYADGEDWTRPGKEKLLEDNAALLHVYVEAAVRGRARSRDTAATLVRWVRGTLSDQVNGGFYNAQTANGIDKALYVDRNAMMAGAFIRAAALFDDVWLRDFALTSLETVIVPAYIPGDGVAHVCASRLAPVVRGLLTDQVHAACALIWAHAATGQLPYSMLAAELIEFALRRMWDERGGRFRDRAAPEDPLFPFELNCHAARVLERLSILTGESRYAERARTILQSLSAEYYERGLFGAPYALAVREVVGRQPPAGLELTRVDWQLE